MRVDRSWMYNRQDQSRKGITEEFIRGTDEFIAFAIHQRRFVSNGMIRCPCSRCDNLKFLDVDVVRTHLYRHGFVPEYYQWVCHGEPYVPMARRECNFNLNSQMRDDSIPTINPCCQITPPQHTPQHALPQPTPNVDFVGTPGFKEAVEEAVNRAVDKKMSEMSLSIWHDIFGAIRSLGESTPTSDRHASFANSSKYSDPIP